MTQAQHEQDFLPSPETFLTTSYQTSHPQVFPVACLLFISTTTINIHVISEPI